MIASTHSVSSLNKINAEVFENQPLMNPTDQKKSAEERVKNVFEESIKECREIKELLKEFKNQLSMHPTDQRTNAAWQGYKRAEEESCPGARSNLSNVVYKGTKTISVEEYEELLKQANAISYTKDGKTVEVTKDEATSRLDQVKNIFYYSWELPKAVLRQIATVTFYGGVTTVSVGAMAVGGGCLLLVFSPGFRAQTALKAGEFISGCIAEAIIKSTPIEHIIPPIQHTVKLCTLV